MLLAAIAKIVEVYFPSKICIIDDFIAEFVFSFLNVFHAELFDNRKWSLKVETSCATICNIHINCK